MESKRVIKARKKFWLELLIGLGVFSFIVFVYLNELPKSIKIMLYLSAIASYIYAYICGYQAGKEHINSVLDFIEPSLRWKVMESEDKMYGVEDEKYKEET